MKKYKLLKTDFILYNSKKLYRIKAIRSFSDIKKGDIGGYVESGDNLSHEDDCWIYGNAKVYEYSEVFGNAKVYEYSEVFGNAKVYEYSEVFGNAKVYEYSEVFGNAKIYEFSEMYGSSRVYKDSEVYGHSKVFGYAMIFGNAKVFGYSTIYGNAKIYGNIKVYGNAKVSENHRIYYGTLITDISNNKNMKDNIRCTFNLLLVNNKIVLYKRVNKKGEKLYSCYDSKFKYKVGEYAECKDYIDSIESCTNGLHASTQYYWNEGNCLIAVEIDLDDIITCQEGKVRCKRLKVLEILDNV